jgi:penicillin-binding protein 2
VNLLDALKVSCNVYFYRLGLRVGVDAWARSGRLLGFGAPTALDLTGESNGLLPDREYLNEKYGRKGWSKGMLANLSVGQGDLLVTPTQMVQMAAAIAMGGRMVQPRLVGRIQEDGSDEWVEMQVKSRDVREISHDVFHRVKEGMFRVVNHSDGTGSAARIMGADVCGKTGTAQNPHGEDHAWFIGFAPRHEPRIALAVVVENGGSGGAVAAPIAGRIFRWFFQEKEKGVS